ncbi:MAG: hypothetical protein KGD59_13185 [Candidatus Heimdallarchaeota archaeon]|nr:hypothetical protein [Candidatus Heimdallarchaeota archaeon]MBY8995501.1 hypothetical protein [Candidatus Heimdallarchaeota archaeon]
MSEKLSVNWKLIIIRVTYWIGVILDFLMALATTIYMLSPGDTFINDIFGYSTITDIGYAILVFETALMLGWTTLLIWADRKPIERRGVLLLTIVPVVGMMFVFNIVGFVGGNPFISVFTIVIQSLIIVLYIASFILATKLAKKNESFSENS